MKVRVINTSYIIGLMSKKTPFIIDAEYISSQKLCVTGEVDGKQYAFHIGIECELLPQDEE